MKLSIPKIAIAKISIAKIPIAKLGHRVMPVFAKIPMAKLGHRLAPVFAVLLLFASMGGTWHIASAAPPPMLAAANAGADEGERPMKKSSKDLTGKLNLNTASEQQLMMLPTVGPAKAERIVTWRKKNGGFKRTADLRRVKGFGYKTFKRLEPFLDVKGDTTLK
jgi:competence ComEA-like helix-hairpin-helix protein